MLWCDEQEKEDDNENEKISKYIETFHTHECSNAKITCIILYLISQFGDSLIGVNLSLTYFLLETGDEKEDLFGLCLDEEATN